MRRDPTEFRQRFAAWKDGENYWDTRGEDMLPGYSGGKAGFYNTHRDKWKLFLISKGVGAEQADRLSVYFAALDSLESGGGTSSAARQKNNFGGMQRGGKNISYDTVQDYMNDKWNMMNKRFSRALNAKTVQEYATLINDPKYAGKGYLYAVADGYNQKNPLDRAWVARQIQHMNNYTKAMMGIAGLKGFVARPVPKAPVVSKVEPILKANSIPSAVELLKQNELPTVLPEPTITTTQTPTQAAQQAQLSEYIQKPLVSERVPVLGGDYWENYFNNNSLDQFQSLIQQLMTSHKHGKNILPRHADGKTPGEYNEELVELPEVRVDDEGNVVNNGRRGSVRLPEVVVKPDHNVREAVDRYYDKLSRRSERAWYTNPITGESYMPKGGPLESVYPEFDLITLGQMSAPILKTAGKRLINSIGDNLSTKGWVYRIPQDENMAYRIIGPLERDWILEGNELSTRATNSLTKAEEIAARNKSGRFNLFKAGAEHGGRKQFAKGQPWLGTTTTHGEPQYLAIPGKDLNWVSGRHYSGPEGYGFSAGDINFGNAPFGSHIDLLTNESGFTGVNPSLMDGSVIYSPYKIFGRNFGYKKLHPAIPQITTENAINATSAQWTAAQDAAIARGDMAEAQRLRDLHFKVSAPDTKVDVPLWSSSEEPFNSFDLSHFGETDNGFFGYGHYLTPIEKYAATYHPVNRKFYVNVKNPYIGSNDQYFNRVQYVKDRLARRKENVIRNLRDGKLTRLSKKLGINESTSLEDAEHLVDKYIADETVKWNDKYIKYVDEFEGKDGVLSWRDIQGIPNKREGIYKEVVVPRGEQIKSADAVTYDDNGVRIPLGERDNFNINDIRYGMVPFLGIGGAAYGLSEYKHGKSPIRINPANRGKFNALKKRTGKTTELLTHSKNPLTRKRAIFALNSRKWRRK